MSSEGMPPIYYVIMALLAGFGLGITIHNITSKINDQKSINKNDTIHSSNLPMYITNNELIVTDCNDAYINFHGTEKKYTINNHLRASIENAIERYIPIEDRAAFRESQENFIKKAEQGKLPHADAYQIFDLRNSPIKNIQGEYNVWIHVDRIISVKDGKPIGYWGVMKPDKLESQSEK